MIERTLETAVHGRYLYEDRGAVRLLVGFHGYAETADAHLAQLEKVPGIGRWSVLRSRRSIRSTHGRGVSWPAG